MFSTQKNILSIKFVDWLLIRNIHIILHDLKLCKIPSCNKKYNKNKTLKDQSANILIDREVRKEITYEYPLVTSEYPRKFLLSSYIAIISNQNSQGLKSQS